MIVFKFKDKEEFKGAVNSLKKAIKGIGTNKFDFNYQPEEKTIQVSEKHADTVEAYLKKKGIKDFTLNRGYGKYSSIASYLKGAAFIIKLAGIKDHAKRELELAGLFDKDSDYGGMVGKAVMELCKCFSGQGHSGFSANMVLELFNTLGKYKTLTPITDDSNEWSEISKEMNGGKVLWQNKRNPAIFSENKGKTWYDVDDKKRIKNRSKSHKKASDKPSIFQRTVYRLPTIEELEEIDSYKLSSDEVFKGLCYTIVGRGTMRQEEKNTIVKSAKLFNEMYPDKYKDVLNKATAISLYR